jgi:hypothetical protein
MAAESALFGTDISLGHRKHVRNLVECAIILADTPFLWLSRIKSYVLVVCWSWGVICRTADVVYWGMSICYAFLINPMP